MSEAANKLVEVGVVLQGGGALGAYECGALNAQLELAYFGLPGFYTPRPDFWTAPTWTYVYDTRPLLVTLGRHVDFAALNASATTFAVTAVEVVTGTLRAFVNRPLGKLVA